MTSKFDLKTPPTRWKLILNTFYFIILSLKIHIYVSKLLFQANSYHRLFSSQNESQLETLWRSSKGQGSQAIPQSPSLVTESTSNPGKSRKSRKSSKSRVTSNPSVSRESRKSRKSSQDCGATNDKQTCPYCLSHGNCLSPEWCPEVLREEGSVFNLPAIVKEETQTLFNCYREARGEETETQNLSVLL